MILIIMSTPSILKIHIDYSDGSYDIIKPFQEDPILISNLERNNSNGDNVYNRFHTNGAIATLLFMTAISNQQTEYYSHDPKVAALLTAWQSASANDTSK